MKNLTKDIKAILSNQCLTIKEKNHLKSVFKNFMIKRDIINRKTIDFELKEDQCFGLDNMKPIL